ncbi:MAG TPA: DUF4012 domain-containing protein [Candidatus Paceibacterota bacterium]
MTDKPPAKVTFTDFSEKPRHVFLIFAICGIFLFAYALNVFHFKTLVSENIRSLTGDFRNAHSAAQELNTEAVSDSLNNVQQKISSLKSNAERLGLPALITSLNNFLPGIKTFPEVLNLTSELSTLSVAAANNINTLKGASLELFNQQEGPTLLTTLEQLAEHLSLIEEKTTQLTVAIRKLKTVSASFASISDILEKNYSPVTYQLKDTEAFVREILAIFKSSEPQHFLLMFQNPTEIRPAGGFLGSFGYMTFTQGNLKEIKVDDIYNADRQLDIKVVPPREMQLLTRDWETRDANWFANFPTSAKKVITFLEQADLFQESNTQFFGAIAINTNVLKTLISFLGPIDIKEYGLTINADNFLQELQYEIEAGRDHQPGQNPKKVLSFLTPLLIEKMATLNENQKHELLNQLKSHLERKDILLYFKNMEMQQFVSNLNIAGEIAALPESFIGDYLMVINANLAGGKTDAFIDQQIKLESALDEKGGVTNTLNITRSHSGQNETEWWYNTANKNYIKILVPLNAQLSEVIGATEPPTKTTYEYIRNGYRVDPDLAAIENSENYLENFQMWRGFEFGKTSFGTRLNIPAGESKTLSLQYQYQLPTMPTPNMLYQFIFEKQSGVQGNFLYTISAPLGFIWKESNATIFHYENKDLKTREIIELTLIKQ